MPILGTLCNIPHVKKINFLFIIGAFISACVLPHSAQAGFGVSPGMVSEQNLVPGARLERTIYLVQADNGQPLEATAVVDDGSQKELKDWISFIPGSSFTIPGGVQQFPLKIVITVPNDAELGKYAGSVTINTVPPKSGEQITIALAARVNLDLSIGDNVISDFSVRSIKILDVVEAQNPKVVFDITNTGNVSVAPDGASFELLNKYGDIRLGYADGDFTEKVPSFSDKKVMVDFPVDFRLSEGEYWGYVKVYKQGKVVAEMKTIFNVTPGSFLVRHGLSVGIIALLVLVLGVLIVVRNRRISRLKLEQGNATPLV